ncbi:hypothetical protein B0H14DRAFT_3643685 [Mycena olivaceomarginata]|nr:hypothetical protein B0H14DRAFT_3643685 [Mycena olivaceomarginata]
MEFSNLLLSFIVAQMISMIGGGFLVANRRTRSPPTVSQSWVEADSARSEADTLRVKTEELDGMLGPASSGRADRQEVNALLDEVQGREGPRSLETKSTEAPVVWLNMNHQPYHSFSTQLVPSSISFRIQKGSQHLIDL